MLRFGLIMLALIWTYIPSYGQLSEVLRSDRPGNTDAATTVGQGMAQIQSGLSYFDVDHVSLDYRTYGPNVSLVARYGIIERLEFRAAFVVRWQTETSMGVENQFGGLEVMNLGLRFNLLDGKEKKPSLGIQADFRVQEIGPPEYRIDEPAPRIFLLFNTPVSNWFLLSSNLGLVWDELGAEPYGAGTLNLSRGISDKVSVFIEAFGNLYFESQGFGMNVGMAYLINNSLQLDLIGSYLGISGDLQGLGGSAGVSWRFGVNRKK